MKNSVAGYLRGRSLGWSLLPLFAAAVLAWAIPVNAGVKKTAQVLDIPLSIELGDWTSPGGNIHVRGMKAVTIHLSDERLVNGRMSWVGDVNADAEGNGVLTATWTHEVGTWTGIEAYLADPVNNPAPVFTPAPDGGVFVGVLKFKVNILTFSGQIQSCTAHGIGGQAEGIQAKVEGGTLPNGLGLYTAQLLDPQEKK